MDPVARRLCSHFLLILFTLPFASSQDISNALSVWWNMDEGSGTTLIDGAGNSAGSIVNDPKWTNGVSGKALYFRTNESTGKVPYVSTYIGPKILSKGSEDGAWTVSVWFKTSEWSRTSSWNSLWGKNGWNATFALNSNANGSVLALYVPVSNWSGSYTYSNLNLQTNLMDGNWHHTAMTWSNRTGSVFLDGTKIGQISIRDVDFFYPFSDNLWVGASYGGPGFTGAMDEFRIYSRSLSTEDIRKLASPTALVTCPTNLQKLSVGAPIQGTTAFDTKTIQIIVSNSNSMEVLREMVNPTSTTWTLSQSLPVGNYSVYLLTTNSAGLGSTTGPISFQILKYSSVQVKTLIRFGVSVAVAKLFGPSDASTSGFRRNGSNEVSTWTNVASGENIALTNLTPLAHGLFQIVTNFVMPDRDVTIEWILDLPAVVQTSNVSTSLRSPSTGGVVSGSTGYLFEQALPDSGLKKVTMTMIRINGDQKHPVYEGYHPGADLRIDVPMIQAIRNNPGPWILETTIQNMAGDLGQATILRRLLFVLPNR